MRKPDEQIEGVVRHSILDMNHGGQFAGLLWKLQVQLG
jgi:hypothetical protein